MNQEKQSLSLNDVIGQIEVAHGVVVKGGKPLSEDGLTQLRSWVDYLEPRVEANELFAQEALNKALEVIKRHKEITQEKGSAENIGGTTEPNYEEEIQRAKTREDVISLLSKFSQEKSIIKLRLLADRIDKLRRESSSGGITYTRLKPRVAAAIKRLKNEGVGEDDLEMEIKKALSDIVSKTISSSELEVLTRLKNKAAVSLSTNPDNNQLRTLLLELSKRISQPDQSKIKSLPQSEGSGRIAVDLGFFGTEPGEQPDVSDSAAPSAESSETDDTSEPPEEPTQLSEAPDLNSLFDEVAADTAPADDALPTTPKADPIQSPPETGDAFPLPENLIPDEELDGVRERAADVTSSSPAETLAQAEPSVDPEDTKPSQPVLPSDTISPPGNWEIPDVDTGEQVDTDAASETAPASLREQVSKKMKDALGEGFEEIIEYAEKIAAYVDSGSGLDLIVDNADENKGLVALYLPLMAFCRAIVSLFDGTASDEEYDFGEGYFALENVLNFDQNNLGLERSPSKKRAIQFISTLENVGKAELLRMLKENEELFVDRAKLLKKAQVTTTSSPADTINSGVDDVISHLNSPPAPATPSPEAPAGERMHPLVDPVERRLKTKEPMLQQAREAFRKIFGPGDAEQVGVEEKYTDEIELLERVGTKELDLENQKTRKLLEIIDTASLLKHQLEGSNPTQLSLVIDKSVEDMMYVFKLEPKNLTPEAIEDAAKLARNTYTNDGGFYLLGSIEQLLEKWKSVVNRANDDF